MRKLIVHLTIVLLLFAAALASCKKTNDITPDALTGSVFGKYSPAGAAATIVAVSNPGNITTAAKLDSSNNGFTIAGLVAGNYVVRFSAMPGFTAPDSVWLPLKAGENFDMGTIVFKTIPPNTPGPGSISGKILPATPGVYMSIKNSAGVARNVGGPDANGDFKIEGVTPDSYELNVIPTMQYSAPASVKVNVTAGNNTHIGTIMLAPAPKKAIDTIDGSTRLYSIDDVNAFVARAAGDSVIVLLGDFTVPQNLLSPALLSAMKKIMIAKANFVVEGASGTLALNGLKEVGSLLVMSGTGLTKLDMPALTTASSIEVLDCPSLAEINTPAITKLSNLILINTGLKSLTAFQSANFKPVTFEIRKNAQLTSLAGLNFATDSVNDCIISNNALLANLNGLQAIKRITHEAVVSGNTTLQSLTGLENAFYARRLTLSSNPQLTNICPAKVLLNYLKDVPDFFEWRSIPGGGRYRVTVQPLVASANGSYATKADLLAAVALCP